MAHGMAIREGITFDDVLIVPAASEVLPTEVDTQTKVTRDIELAIPLMSAAMDTVTENRLAIAMAQAGGIGVIHRNMEPARQAEEVRKVKRFESGMVVNPITISPEAALVDALRLMADNQISGIPVVEGGDAGSRTRDQGRLVGILTNRDVRFASDPGQPVGDLMTRKVVTVHEGVSMDEARRLLHQHRIEKLVVIDKNHRCIGLITVKDIEKAQTNPFASKDNKGRLRVAAATGTGPDAINRAAALFDAEVDILVVDTAHGHSKRVIDTVRDIRRLSNATQIMAGNVATADGARALIDVGADAIKVGIGPGSICTTRIVAGIGVPQITAILDVSDVARTQRIPVISDGGIKYSGDIAKAIAAGADAVMLGSLFSGTDESPGDVIVYQGHSYKIYRGMGSIGAMTRGSADRYFQQDMSPQKMVPEGVEGRVPYKGPLTAIIHQLIGGLRAAMGYTGHASIRTMQTGCQFVRLTNAGLRESHVHDSVTMTETSNYHGNL